MKLFGISGALTSDSESTFELPQNDSKDKQQVTDAPDIAEGNDSP